MGTRISEMEPVGAVQGDELLEVVQDGGNKKATVEQLNAFQRRKDQTEPTRQVVFQHNLGKVPNIRVCNSVGKEVEAEVTHAEDLNTTYIDFSSDFTGFVVAD